jgi:hypothetical protein
VTRGEKKFTGWSRRWRKTVLEVETEEDEIQEPLGAAPGASLLVVEICVQRQVPSCERVENDEIEEGDDEEYDEERKMRGAQMSKATMEGESGLAPVTLKVEGGVPL